VSSRILITGGGGFIGAPVCRALLEQGHEVTTFGRAAASSPYLDSRRDGLEVIVSDLADRERLTAAVAGRDLIFHKASVSSPSSSGTADDFVKSNINGTQSLIDSIRASSEAIRHLVFDSSISVYGEGCYLCNRCGVVRPPARRPVDVERHRSFELFCPNCSGILMPTETVESDALNGSSAYALSKTLQEKMLISASRQIGFSLTILRYATVYGAGQRASNVYTRLLKGLVAGHTITVNEDGLQKRDFVHVGDVVAANLLAVANHDKEQLRIFNIGSGVETSLRDFFEMARDITKTELLLAPGSVETSNVLVPGDIRHCKIRVRTAQDKLGFSATRDLRNGLGTLLHSIKASKSASPLI
jgi:dTDP-L-rhamnose 4-epimerase